MTTAFALTLTALVAYGTVEAGLALAGPSRLGRGVVLTMALLTGFAIPWGIVGGLAGLLAVRNED